MKNFKKILNKIFLYKEPQTNYEFILTEKESNTEKIFDLDKTNNNYSNNANKSSDKNKEISSNLNENLDYIKVKYNTLINSDIKLREFKLKIKGKEYNAFLLFIDGMINSNSINDFILKPIMAKNSIPINNTTNMNLIKGNVNVKKIKKFNLEELISNTLVPQNTMQKISSFEEIFKSVNMGDCALFVDTIPVCFVIDVKGFEARSITEPKNEIVVRGSQ